MTPGPGHRFTAKQDRQAKHIAASLRKRNSYSKKEARRAGYAIMVSRINKRKKRR